MIPNPKGPAWTRARAASGVDSGLDSEPALDSESILEFNVRRGRRALEDSDHTDGPSTQSVHAAPAGPGTWNTVSETMRRVTAETGRAAACGSGPPSSLTRTAVGPDPPDCSPAARPSLE